MKYTYSALLLTLLITHPVFVSAEISNRPNVDNVPVPVSDQTAAFRQLIPVPTQSILVPTVVSVPLPSDDYLQNQFLVQAVSDGAFIGAVEINTSNVHSTSLTARVNGGGVYDTVALTDRNHETYTQFEVLGDTRAAVVLTVTSSQPITTSGFKLNPAPHVALPLTVAILAEIDNVITTVTAEKPMEADVVRFPEVTATTFVVTLTYGQPLRIEEISFLEASPTVRNERALRFLAQPGESYVVYLDSDRTVRVVTTEAGNLQSNEEVLKLPVVAPVVNTQYVLADIDDDTIADRYDNCVHEANADQLDINDNGRGDVCEDFDRDGITNPNDNCPSDPNRNQADEDGDEIGDACDTEESRFTEQNPWIPWVGLGTAALVLLTLFALVATTKRPKTLATSVPTNE